MANQNQKLAFATMQNWIESCKTAEQVAHTHEIIITHYDGKYHAAGSVDSEILHDACLNKAEWLKSKACIMKVLLDNHKMD